MRGSLKTIAAHKMPGALRSQACKLSCRLHVRTGSCSCSALRAAAVPP